MVTKRVSKAKEKPETELQNYDELNKINVPLTALRFELAEWNKQSLDVYPLGDLILIIQMVIRKKERDEYG